MNDGNGKDEKNAIKVFEDEIIFKIRIFIRK